MSHLRIYLGRLMNEQYTPPPKPKIWVFFSRTQDVWTFLWQLNIYRQALYKIKNNSKQTCKDKLIQ